MRVYLSTWPPYNVARSIAYSLNKSIDGLFVTIILMVLLTTDSLWMTSGGVWEIWLIGMLCYLSGIPVFNVCLNLYVL